MKFVSIVLLALTVAAAYSVSAQTIDLSEMTCGNFLKSDKDKMKLIVTWFAGFYTVEKDPQVLDITTINELQDKFTAFCTKESNFRMTTAAEGILGN